VGDNASDVLSNRQCLADSLHLSEQPLWLQQVHGTVVEYAPTATGTPIADASYSDQVGRACVVMTADCLPVLLCNQQGTQVAAAHAGWRGLCNGVLRNTVATFSSSDQVMAYLGPAIGPEAFEVGAEVLQAFTQKSLNEQHRQQIELAFMPSPANKYRADLYGLARAELVNCGVKHIYGGDYCVYSSPEQFYSYRRESVTGRFASLIWLVSND
jgi:YfiH family protein